MLPHLRAPLLVASAFFCFAWVFLAVAALLPASLTVDRGWSAGHAGWLVSVTTLGGAVGSLVAGPLMRWGVSVRKLTAIGLLLPAAASFVMFADTASPALIVTATAIFFLAGGLVPAVAFAAVPRLVDDARALGPVNGLLAQFGSLGSLTGPPLLIVWVDWTGWIWAPLPVAVISIAGLAFAWAAFSGSRTLAASA